MTVAAPAATNAPEWTVSELSGALKRTLESEFGFVRVRAEISGYRGPHSSGHAYFSLKDQGARLDAVIWRSTFMRLKVKPAEGLEVVVTGKVTTFPGKSSYQIIVESIAPAGVGALMALLEERRKQLTAEGLFDTARKRPIPYLPRIIGVVTSPTGAVIRDILHRIADRFPSHVLVWPVRVQGETSAAEVAAAIAGFNVLEPGSPIPRPQVLIVARGGGSLEDLWGFNDEAVVRAVAASAIPLVSAVGHETDTTLIDHAADLRAPTPTGAAEMCVPVRAELLLHVGHLGRRGTAAADRTLARSRTELRSAVRALPNGEDIVAVPRQRLDAGGARLAGALRGEFDGRRLLLLRIGARLAAQSPRARTARAGAHLESLEGRLRRALRVAEDRRRQSFGAVQARLAAALAARIALARQHLQASRGRYDATARRLEPTHRAGLARLSARVASLAQTLGTLGYRNVLARGFALVRDADGAPLRSARALAPGIAVEIEFSDGRVAAVATEDGTPAAPTPIPSKSRSARAKQRPDNQGTLF